MKNLNQIKISKKLAIATSNVMLSMAYVNTIRPIIEANQKRAMDAVKPKWSAEFAEMFGKTTDTVITDYKDLCNTDDTQAEMVFNLMDEYAKEAGFDVEEGYCPLLIAENEQRKAERQMIDAAKYITGLDHYSPELWRNFPNTYNKYKENLLKFVNSAPKSMFED